MNALSCIAQSVAYVNLCRLQSSAEVDTRVIDTDNGLQLSLTYPYLSFSNVYTNTALEGLQQSSFDTSQAEGYTELVFLIHCHQNGVFPR